MRNLAEGGSVAREKTKELHMASSHRIALHLHWLIRIGKWETDPRQTHGCKIMSNVNNVNITKDLFSLIVCLLLLCSAH